MRAAPRLAARIAALALAWVSPGAAYATNTANATNTGTPPSALRHARAVDVLTDVVGRSDSAPDGSVRFGYPGVSFLLEFEGRTLSVDAASSGSRSLLDVRIDGGASQVIALSTEPRCVVLLSEAYSARHQVEIMHRSETWHGIVSIREFSFDGSLAPGAPPPQRKIMLLGDSVTCGEAIDRADGGGEAGSRSNPRLSYGMLAASALHAQAVLVCYGGRGLVRSWNGRTDELNLPDFFQLAIADPANLVRWDHARYDPDVIVCAIGTNDFTEGIPEREAYVDAYAGFVATLLRTHKRAQIVLTEGAILDGDKKSALSAYLAQTVARVADSRVRVVRSRHYPGDASDAHPTREQHAEMAQDLAEQLRTIMNW